MSLIERLGLTDLFGAICGGDTFAFRKPDPRHLTETIARAGGDPARALMVGDSRTDIDTAKAAGIPVVAVDFGYTDRHVREFEPSEVISHFDELTVALVDRLIAAAGLTACSAALAARCRRMAVCGARSQRNDPDRPDTTRHSCAASASR